MKFFKNEIIEEFFEDKLAVIGLFFFLHKIHMICQNYF